jgi:hypothetical protein
MTSELPPRRDDPTGQPINVTPIPASMTGDAIWKKPDSPERILRVFQAVRDRDLSHVRVLLETQLPGAVEVDGPGFTPVSIDWDSCLAQNLAWCDTWGTMGPGLVVKHDKKPIAMIQIGAAEVDMETYSMIPNTWFIEKFVLPGSRTGFVLTQRNHFLTYQGMRSFGDPDHLRTVVPDDRLWYQVTKTSFEFALERLVKRYSR